MASEVSVSVNSQITNPLSPRIDDAVISAWIEGRLNDARNTFIVHMSGGGGGRSYRRGKSGVHQASAPGDYPASDSGRLANSVDYQMVNPREGQLRSDIEYAAYLTDGTTRMASRKMLVDAMEEVLEARPMDDELAQAVSIVGGTFYNTGLSNA